MYPLELVTLEKPSFASRMLRRKRKAATAAVVEDDEWAAFAHLIDDTMTSIQLLLSRNSEGCAALGLPPLALWHQLYTILPNRTFVDQNVHRFQTEGRLMAIKIPSGADDVVIVRTEDYVAELQKREVALREQIRQHPGDKAVVATLNALASFRRALPQLASQSTASIDMFVVHMNESEDCSDKQQIRAMVGQVQRLGFLLPTPRLDDGAYSFSIPGVGKLVSAIRKTRTLIIRTLKRTKYKEMHEQQLKKAKLACSCFQLEFHLADMEGCGLIRRTKVTSGVLVALADK